MGGGGGGGGAFHAWNTIGNLSVVKYTCNDAPWVPTTSMQDNAINEMASLRSDFLFLYCSNLAWDGIGCSSVCLGGAYPFRSGGPIHR